jgi:hypothetical protein
MMGQLMGDRDGTGAIVMYGRMPAACMQWYGLHCPSDWPAGDNDIYSFAANSSWMQPGDGTARRAIIIIIIITVVH